jgi:hypothetical protein
MDRGVGFCMHETMRGTHRLRRAIGDLPAGSEQPFEFEVSWGHACLTCFLNPLSKEFGLAELEGTVDAGGLCQRAPLRGTLAFRYIPEGKVWYRFEFGSDRRFRFEGAKRDIRPWNLHRTHTLLEGEVREVETRELVSEAVLRFDLHELPSLLGSFRLL